MANWVGLTATTFAEYIKGEEVGVMRNHKILGMLQDRGRVSFNHSGLNMVWDVRYRRAPMQGFADSDTLTFARQNRHKQVTLPWRGYTITDSFTDFEKEQNKGDTAIVKYVALKSKHLLEDINEQFGETECYVDGNASGNDKRFHGIESFLSTSGASTKQPIGLPNDTYGGLSATLGTAGGNWSTTGTTTTATDWPTGTGDAQYDYWSPLIVDYTSTISTSDAAGTYGWAAATKTWPNTCVEATRYLITHSQKNKSKHGELDLITIESRMYRQLKDKAHAEEGIYVTRGSPDGVYKLGFKDVINLDGIDVTSEYGIASNVGYGWNFDSIEICSLLGSMFMPEGPDRDISGQAYRFAVKIMGNFKYASPRGFGKLINVT